MKLVLDTNIYCDYAEGVGKVVEALAEFDGDLYLPAPVIGELGYGFMKGTQEEINNRMLQTLINRLDIGIIDITRDVARKYAIVFNQLTKKGKKIPINDVWIAACCLHIGGTLFSRDSHFDVIETLDRFRI